MLKHTYSKLSEGAVITHPDLPVGEWLVVHVWEQQPMITSGNRSSSYENSINLSKLNPDGTYHPDNEHLVISTSHVFAKSLDEDDIAIIRTMRKTYI